MPSREEMMTAQLLRDMLAHPSLLEMDPDGRSDGSATGSA